jgi:hypothetical protein
MNKPYSAGATFAFPLLLGFVKSFIPYRLVWNLAQLTPRNQDVPTRLWLVGCEYVVNNVSSPSLIKKGLNERLRYVK